LRQAVFTFITLLLVVPVAEASLTSAMNDITEQIENSGASSEPASGSSYDPNSGVTTSAQGSVDGSRTVTQTDSEGKKISEEKIPAQGTPGATSYDEKTGVTTSSQANTDGSRTVRKIDRNGNVISEKVMPPRGKDVPSASSYDPATGITTLTALAPSPRFLANRVSESAEFSFLMPSLCVETSEDVTVMKKMWTDIWV
jgi:hypothetical protein